MLREAFGVWVNHNEETQTLWVPEMSLSYLQNMPIYLEMCANFFQS